MVNKTKKQKTTNKAVETLNRLSSSEATLNELRIEFGLKPIEYEMANQKFTTKQFYKHEELG